MTCPAGAVSERGRFSEQLALMAETHQEGMKTGVMQCAPTEIASPLTYIDIYVGHSTVELVSAEERNSVSDSAPAPRA